MLSLWCAHGNDTMELVGLPCQHTEGMPQSRVHSEEVTIWSNHRHAGDAIQSLKCVASISPDFA
jgi:hypothetical protein